jgi:hypothetical protein
MNIKFVKESRSHNYRFCKLALIKSTTYPSSAIAIIKEIKRKKPRNGLLIRVMRASSLTYNRNGEPKKFFV